MVLGGKLSGPSHSKNNGMPIINPDTGEVQAFMEGDEGIINKRSMNDTTTYTVTGTPNQIASKINSIGGGVDWAGGASLTKFMNGGSYLGSSVQPPVFRSYFESRNQNSTSQNFDTERLDRIETYIESLATLQGEESIKKVVISSREMSNIQRENNKQSEIATL